MRLLVANVKIKQSEIVASDNRSIKSLSAFKEKYGKRVGRGIVLHHGEIHLEDNILWLPYYMASVL